MPRSYHDFDTSIGTLRLVGDERRLERVDLPNAAARQPDAGWREKRSALPAALHAAKRQLVEYFDGTRAISTCRSLPTAPRSSARYGKSSAVSRTARPSPTASWLAASASRRRHARWARRTAGTRSPSSCPATVSSAPTARSPATAAACRSSKRSSPSNAEWRVQRRSCISASPPRRPRKESRRHHWCRRRNPTRSIPAIRIGRAR